MKRLIDVSEEKGFTLIELMAILVIIGVMASVAVKKYTNISISAELRAIDVGISELNSRETLTWANLIINQGNYPGDEAIWAMMTTSPTRHRFQLPLGQRTGQRHRGATLLRQSDHFADPGSVHAAGRCKMAQVRNVIMFHNCNGFCQFGFTFLPARFLPPLYIKSTSSVLSTGSRF